MQDGFLSSSLMRFEPERPTMGAMIGDDRIAVVEPRLGRLVVYDHTRGPWRPAIRIPTGNPDSDGAQPLSADLACVAYDGSRDVTLPDGTALRFTGADDSYTTQSGEVDGTVTLRIGDGDQARSTAQVGRPGD